MGYGLGVDLGTTFTAAALERDGRVEMATLGDRAAAVPSVVLLRSDGSVLTGDAADRRAASDPDRVAREVKRRLGDPTPVILGGSPQPVQELMAMQLRDVVRAVAEREGERPESVTLTHPANWGPYKRELFGQIPHRAGLEQVRMLTEPEAAAAHYASTERLPDGALVAVYDLGGGTFDATVLRAAGEGGFEILGTPEGIEGLGGIDFDEAVYAHVDRVCDGAVSALDPADPRATSAAIRLRQECVLAKEALSADTETTIPVLLPALQTEVRLTRGELESMILPAVGATVESMRRALRSAQVTPADLYSVLLVGGSSRIPAVARMVSAELGRPTSVDAHPKHAIALGAASVARDASTAVQGAAPGTPPGGLAAAAIPAYQPAGPTQPIGPGHGGPGHGGLGTSPMPPTPEPAAEGTPMPVPGAPLPAAGTPAPALQAQPAPRRRRRVGLAVGGGVLVAALGVGGALFYGGASGASPQGPTAPAPAGMTSEPAPAPALVPTTESDPVVASQEPPPRRSTSGGAGRAGGVAPTPERVAPRNPGTGSGGHHTGPTSSSSTSSSSSSSSESPVEQPDNG